LVSIVGMTVSQSLGQSPCWIYPILDRGGVTLSESSSFSEPNRPDEDSGESNQSTDCSEGMLFSPIQKPTSVRINPMPEMRDTHASPRGTVRSRCEPRLARAPFTTSQRPMTALAVSTGRSDCSYSTLPTTRAVWRIASASMAMMPIAKLTRLKRGNKDRCR
jgi:hypothetical protein